jgi:hypothetical protein
MLHCQKLKTSLQHSSAHRPAPQERRPPWAVGPLALSRARLAMVGGIRCSATRARTTRPGSASRAEVERGDPVFAVRVDPN